MANFKTSYVKLNETVDQVFPPTKSLHPEFNDFNFWKSDLSQIEIIVDESADQEKDESSDDDYQDSNGDLFDDRVEEQLQAMKSSTG